MTDGRLHYSFSPVAACNMCGAAPDRFRMMGMRLNRSQGLNPRAAAGIAVAVKKCRNCDLVFADPQPLPADFAEHYGHPDDYWESGYFDSDPAYFAQEIAEAKALLPYAPGMRALDIGAGIGKAMQALQAAGFEAFGIEPGAEFRDVALKRGLSADRLGLGGVEEAQFPDQHFDFITFGAVLEHLQSPSESIERALNWLKPNGIIQLEVPSSAHLIPRLINLYFTLRNTNYVTNTSPMHPPYHLFEFGLRSFQRHGARAGYAIASHRYSVCDIFHLPRITHPILRWYMARTSTGMQLTAYLRKADRSEGEGNEEKPE